MAMYDLPMEIPEEFLRPLVSGWVGKLEAADKARAHWKELAEECQMFYSKSAAAMFNPDYARKFWRGVKAPRFRISLNKAYEYVAIMLPQLFWEVPHRKVTAQRPTQIPDSLLMGMGDEQQIQMLRQQIDQEQMQRDAVNNMVAFMLEDWLNYTPREVPGGGLAGQSELAVVDALITGRGVLVIRPFSFPASNRTLTGAFRLPPSDLLTDPDSSKIQDCKWIAVKHVDPHWEVEERFKLESGSLRNRASLESSWSYGEGSSNIDQNMHRAAGQTNDLVVWYELWSKTGVGTRLTGMASSIGDHLQEVVGKYAYLAICPTAPFPLNCTAEQIRNGLTSEQVKQKFAWPIPLWTDERYPIEVLDFYPNTDEDDESASWPIPPMSPAMGELKFLNFLVPWLCNRVYNSARDFWAVAGPHYDHYVKYLQEGGDQTVIPTPLPVQDVRQAVQILQQPETRMDIWKVIQLVSDLFDKRTGLVEGAYGTNPDGTQSRSAEDVIAKQRAIGIRPDFMQKKVVGWQSEVASTEAYVTRWFVTGDDVEPRLGKFGRFLWEKYVMSTDVELTVRQMNYEIAASSIRRPNRDRDVANFMQAIQYWLPIYQEYAQATGNFEPLNQLIRKWGELHDMNMDELMLPPPQPDPQQQQMQQQQMQLEFQKLQTEIEGKKLDIQAKMMEVQAEQSKTEIELEAEKQKMDMDIAKFRQGMEMDAMKGNVDLMQDRAKFMQNLQQTAVMGKIKAQQAQKAKPNASSGNGSRK